MGRERRKSDDLVCKRVFKRVAKGRLVAVSENGSGPTRITHEYPSAKAAERAVREIDGMRAVVEHDALARAERSQ